MYRKLSEAFLGAAVKYLTDVDIPTGGSHQHEIGGLVKAGIGRKLTEKIEGKNSGDFATTYVRLTDTEEPSVVTGSSTWYDARAGKSNRGPEYRLYYRDNEVVRSFAVGDFLLVALTADYQLLIITAPRGSMAETEIRSIFGNRDLLAGKGAFSKLAFSENGALLPLEAWFASVLHIDLVHEADDELYLREMKKRFGDAFPDTRTFSRFAREIAADADPVNQPDETLVLWQQEEEHLFRLFEKELIKKRLQPFLERQVLGDDDVSEFVEISKSVLNRRKSRAGAGFQNHIEAILMARGIPFTAQARTERKERPDFLFPGESFYHDPAFPAENLRILAAKTTLKERWSQVMREADRISRKHLITLDPGMTDDLVREAHSKDLVIVLPKPLHGLYSPETQSYFQSFIEFIEELARLHYDRRKGAK